MMDHPTEVMRRHKKPVNQSFKLRIILFILKKWTLFMDIIERKRHKPFDGGGWDQDFLSYSLYSIYKECPLSMYK